MSKPAEVEGRGNPAGRGGVYSLVSTAVGELRIWRCRAWRGDIEFPWLRTPGVIAVRAGGGSVRAERVAAQALRVESTVGSITLSALSVPAVTATSGGGRIRVGGFAAVRTMQLRSAAENVEVAVPPDASATFTLRTTVGRLEVSALVRVVERTAHRFSGRMGTGATHVDASSASGIVRLHSP